MVRLITLAVILFSFLTSCVSEQEKAAKAFEEGATISKDAHAALDKGDEKTADGLFTQSIEKYKEAIKLDSTHTSARKAIADSYYGSKNFNEAINWYDQANKVHGDSAANHKGIGLSRLALGELSNGQQALDQAIALDHSKEMLTSISNEVVKIGENNFSEGAALIKNGHAEAGKKNQSYGMSVLMLGYYYDNTRKDIAEKIATYADAVGDYTVKMQYTKLSQQ